MPPVDTAAGIAFLVVLLVERAGVALTVVAALAVVAGRVILRRVPLQLVHRMAGVLFALWPWWWH